jgi:Flp pilus assembly protein TadD
VWNMLGDRGRTVDVVGWLATYPAEDINGLMITDRAGYLAYAGATGGGVLAPGVISPQDSAAAIAKLVVKSETLDYDDFRRILDIDRGTFDKMKVIEFDKINPINNLIMLYATARTYQNIARHLLKTNQPDFLGVYFEWCDAVGHLFMTYYPPRLAWVDEKDFEKYKKVMFNTYDLQDRMLGEMMDLCDDETVIMITSDHGFKSGANRPRLSSDIDGGHAAFWHQLDGIVALYGNGIRRGYRIEGAGVIDVAPTILALEGMPQAADMPGKVLMDAFDDSLAARVNRTVVPTLESGKPQQKATVAAGASDEETMKKLEALGYVTTMNPNDYNNLGQRLQAQGQYDKAIEQFKKALEINPNFPGALNNIGVCYGKIKQYDLAEEAFKKVVSLKKTDVYAMNNLAILYMETGRLEDAARYAEMAVSTEPNYSNGHLSLGSIYATQGDLDRAEKEFMRALELDPASRSAKANLERVRAEKSKGSQH